MRFWSRIGCRRKNGCKRIRSCSVFKDTTELDFNAQETIGLGPLTYEAQRGMFVHPTYAVTPQREPLGILDAWMWAREKKDGSGQPGAQTIWKGLTKVHIAAETMRFYAMTVVTTLV